VQLDPPEMSLRVLCLTPWDEILENTNGKTEFQNKTCQTTHDVMVLLFIVSAPELQVSEHSEYSDHCE